MEIDAKTLKEKAINVKNLQSKLEKKKEFFNGRSTI